MSASQPIRPSRPGLSRFDRLSSADRLLLAVGVLFFADCFAHWQSTCCPRPNAWAGNGSILGALAGLSAFALAVWTLLPVAGVRAPARWPGWPPWSGSEDGSGSPRLLTWPRWLGSGRRSGPAPPVGTGLAVAALAFGSLKFLVVLFHHPATWAFAGLGLLVVAGYGAYMKLEERRAGGPLPRRAR